MARRPHSNTRSGRWKPGLALAVIRVFSWPTLPVRLKAVLVHLAPWTLTWFRFLMAEPVMGPLIVRRETGGALQLRTPGSWVMLLLAALAVLVPAVPGVVQIPAIWALDLGKG